MRLLIITVACDPAHPYAGHVPSWVASVARFCEQVDVIAPQVGGTPPPNVHYHSLGKEHGRGRFARWLRFVAFAARLVPRSDAVFVMFSATFVLGVWPFARLWGKPVTFWWAHGAVTRSLRVAEKLVDRVVTSSAHGFRIPSTKTRIVGQGIPTEHYRPAARSTLRPFTAISVGRLRAVKRFEDLVDAVALMQDDGEQIAVRIVGASDAGKEAAYEQELRGRIQSSDLHGTIALEGDVPQAEMPARYGAADVMVNLGETGSMDKVVLEAMACAVPVLSANVAYAGMLGAVEPRLVLEPRQPWAARYAARRTRSVGATVARHRRGGTQLGRAWQEVG
jgi:glycosyltransferase involved in cell wall biosynthesis